MLRVDLYLTCLGILLMAMRYSLSRMQFPRALPKHLNKTPKNNKEVERQWVFHQSSYNISYFRKIDIPVLQCSLHAVRDSFLSGLLQRQSFRLQSFTDSVPDILMERPVLEEECTLHANSCGRHEIYIMLNSNLIILIRLSIMRKWN